MFLSDVSANPIRGCRIEDIVQRSEWTPEERLFLAVVVQAILDVFKEDDESGAARDFLDDPNVQRLTQALWGVRTSGFFDCNRAEDAISAYRFGRGQKLKHRRKRKKDSRRS
jgi:hypothetical protein